MLLRREPLQPAYQLQEAGAVQERIHYTSTDGMDGRSRLYGALDESRNSRRDKALRLAEWHGTPKKH